MSSGPALNDPFPLRRLKRGRAAEREHRRVQLGGDRLPVRERVRDEHVRAARSFVGLAVDRERRTARDDEVELLMTRLILTMRLHDVLSDLGRGVGVAAERANPARRAHRMPDQVSRPGNRLQLIEMDYAGRLGHVDSLWLRRAP